MIRSLAVCLAFALCCGAGSAAEPAFSVDANVALASLMSLSDNHIAAMAGYAGYGGGDAGRRLRRVVADRTRIAKSGVAQRSSRRLLCERQRRVLDDYGWEAAVDDFGSPVLHPRDARRAADWRSARKPLHRQSRRRRGGSGDGKRRQSQRRSRSIDLFGSVEPAARSRDAFAPEPRFLGIGSTRHHRAA